MKAVSHHAPHENHADHGSLRARIIGLTVACPHDQGNPSHCFICGIRELPLGERYRWAMSLEHHEMVQIVETHERCLHAIERAGSAPHPHRHRSGGYVHETAHA